MIDGDQRTDVTGEQLCKWCNLVLELLQSGALVSVPEEHFRKVRILYDEIYYHWRDSRELSTVTQRGVVVLIEDLAEIKHLITSAERASIANSPVACHLSIQQSREAIEKLIQLKANGEVRHTDVPSGVFTEQDAKNLT